MLSESWQPLADTLGFRDESEMLKHLYVMQGFSLKELHSILGYSSWAIRRRLIVLGIPLHSRGGAKNREGKRRLKHLTDEELFKTGAAKLALANNVHISTVFWERRQRKGDMKDALLSDNANVDVSDLRSPLEVSHGAGTVSESEAVPGVLPAESGGRGDGDS